MWSKFLTFLQVLQFSILQTIIPIAITQIIRNPPQMWDQARAEILDRVPPLERKIIKDLPDGDDDVAAYTEGMSFVGFKFACDDEAAAYTEGWDGMKFEFY